MPSGLKATAYIAWLEVPGAVKVRMSLALAGLLEVERFPVTEGAEGPGECAVGRLSRIIAIKAAPSARRQPRKSTVNLGFGRRRRSAD